MAQTRRNFTFRFAFLLSFTLVFSAQIGHQHGRLHNHQVDGVSSGSGSAAANEPSLPPSQPAYGSSLPPATDYKPPAPAGYGASGTSPSGGVRQTFKTIGYYVGWAIYGRNFPPQNINTSRLTHINYAFAGINNKTGEAVLTDIFADVQKVWPGDVAATDNRTSLLFGNLKQLYLLKKQNRNLKTLLSIGGWTYRMDFGLALTNSTANRHRFVKTGVALLRDLGFDGLDIDWEYPGSDQEAAALVHICQLFREELDAYAATVEGKPHFLLTLAVPAGPQHFRYFDLPGLAPYIDFMNLMAYDYQGSSFSNFSGHNSNVYKSDSCPRSTDFDTNTAVEFYLKDGVLSREQLNLGLPLYGRSFANTSGPGMPFSPAKDGSWENGVWDYKVLPLNNTPVYTDNDIIASYSYSNQTRYMVSYDTPEIAARKAQWIERHGGIGGAMWWDLSGDRPMNDSRSLIRTVTNELFLSGGGLEEQRNCLSYPHSKYANLRAGMA